MAAPVLQQLLKLDGTVGHEVVVADGGIVEDSQLDLACKVGNILYYSMGIQCSKIYYLSQCAYSYEGGNIKKKLGLSLEDTLNLFVN